MNTDPIADFLTRIRNSIRAGKLSVSIPHSRLKESIARLLEEKGWIEKSRVDQTSQFPVLIITLNGALSELTRISKPGRRVYKKASDIRTVRSGYGASFLSTSRGIMTGDEAKAAGIGGELLCEIF